MDFDLFFYKAMMYSEGFTFTAKRDCTLLTISPPNAKIAFWQLNLPAGYTCPFALDCFAKANRETGKIIEPKKKDNEFRCYAATQEAIYPNTRTNRHSNFDLLLTKKTLPKIVDLLVESIQNNLPRSEGIFRLHASGDFYSQLYFDAWLETVKHFSDIGFYAYTKSLPYWIKRKNQIPENFILTASKGGKQDDIIDKYNLKYSVVVFSEEDARNYPLTKYWQKKLNRKKGLPIDKDDSHAFSNDEPFALLLHSIQPKGTKAGEAFRALKGASSYKSKG